MRGVCTTARCPAPGGGGRCAGPRGRLAASAPPTRGGASSMPHSPATAPRESRCRGPGGRAPARAAPAISLFVSASARETVTHRRCQCHGAKLIDARRVCFALSHVTVTFKHACMADGRRTTIGLVGPMFGKRNASARTCGAHGRAYVTSATTHRCRCATTSGRQSPSSR